MVSQSITLVPNIVKMLNCYKIERNTHTHTVLSHKPSVSTCGRKSGQKKIRLSYENKTFQIKIVSNGRVSAGGVFRVGVVRDDCKDITLRHKHVGGRREQCP